MRRKSYFHKICEFYKKVLAQTGSEQSSMKQNMEIFRHVNSSVASYTSYIHISVVPLITTQVLVILLSKSVI